MKKGFFITFEGGDSVGKSTQASRLEQCLSSSGKKTFLTREIGGTPVSEAIRSLFATQHDGSRFTMDPITELLLVYAARRQHVVDEIKPRLMRGEVVVCDRFYDLSIAYQGYGKGVSDHIFEMMNNITLDGVEPDLTFLFVLDEEIRRQRILERHKTLAPDYFESQADEYHRLVNDGYLQIAKHKKRFVLVDASKSIEEISAQVNEKVAQAFLENGFGG